MDFPSIFDKMKKHLFQLIILINSIALLGIFLTQIYFVREAYQQMDEQFAGSVRIALKGVSDQMLNFELKKARNKSVTNPEIFSDNLPDIHNLNLNLLDFKIGEEFNCMKIGKGYEYAIIDLKDHSIVTGIYKSNGKELITSRHQVSMIGFTDSENYILSAYFPDERNLILMRMVNWIILSVVFAVMLIIGFPLSLYVFYRQKRVSEMKSDFINNMTHEFKTPIATISLASEMLMKKSIIENPARTQQYAKIIFEENTRLQNHVEQILSVSLLERGQFRLKKKEVDVHEIITELVENFSLTVKERNGEIRTHYCANNYHIYADKAHLTNVLANLLDNANKYSPEAPWIRIGTQNTHNGLIISVEDRGMGISLEFQQQIFKKLYRVPTGNLYNVKGFGIGLYYVKTIVEAHGGHINLKSELNKGSRFDVYLPFVFKSPKENDNHETQNSSG
jgi:two-component system, OmpR family, phosphate regulon sensor histidine kinase PhoR